MFWKSNVFQKVLIFFLLIYIIILMTCMCLFSTVPEDEADMVSKQNKLSFAQKFK